MTPDAAAAGADSFELEVVSQMSEQDYLAWNELKSERPGRARAARWILTIVAMACFLSWRTAAIGVVLGLAAAAAWTMPRWIAWGGRDTYRRAEYLHGPLIYGVSSRGLWFRGGALRADCGWEGLMVWGEREGSFWLSPGGMPQLIFPIGTLRQAGIYDRVRELAALHGVEYDSAAARAGGRREPASTAT